MNDYLRRLAARTLNRIEMVEPRPLSRFEPLPGTGPLAPTPARKSPVDNGDEPAAPAPVPPQTTRPAAQPPAAPAPGPNPTARTPEMERRSPSDQLPDSSQQVSTPRSARLDAPGREPSADPSTVQPPLQPVNQLPPRQRPQQPDAARAQSSPGARQPAGQPPQPVSRPADRMADAGRARRGDEVGAARDTIGAPGPTEETVIRRVAIEPTPSPTIASPVEVSSRARAVAPARHAAADHSAPTLEPAAPAPARFGAQPRPARQPDAASTTAPPPTVRVTIGRIEVRAARPPQPAQPAVREEAAPSMGLDDYLRRRSGGGGP